MASTLKFAGLFLITAVSAAVVNSGGIPNASKWVPGSTLEPGHLIVPLDGVEHAVKESDYLNWLKSKGVLLKAPELDPSWVTYNASDIPAVETREVVTERDLEARAPCSQTYSITTDNTITFVDWDLQMSTVACAHFGDLTVTVTSGHSIANTIGGSAGVDLGFVKDRLTGSLGINYSRTWTTTQSTSDAHVVHDGFCGVMIYKPITTRRYGRQFVGCVGNIKQVGTWYADSHKSASYNGLSWVEGAVSYCEKRQANPPLSRCEGGGNFI
ncbi:hypothetical protein BGZ61DRAFT_421822 [Ilyonectria robusta]|uniref:uncharacterized protein n=1 Tax=Ilyonectria robusta TaxID=1079257 RepID=UPI001E8D722C|nr:uncharacterized protein BGZ61DRAFT_421822 [Ilyonectria robusta]KAH8688547.1 hypothetical protein BGZ61DRAFT_421822 [Ilyonectria robusta]